MTDVVELTNLLEVFAVVQMIGESRQNDARVKTVCQELVAHLLG